MPSIALMLQNPVSQWPQLILFQITRLTVPDMWDRLTRGVTKEVTAYEYAIRKAPEGNADAVLRALDEFGRKRFLMNVGDEKGPILDDLIKKHKPMVVVELGGYLGYSAISIAKQLPPGAKLISIEYSAFHAALADKLVEWAGLRDRVRIVIGDSTSTIPTLKKRFGIDTIDMVFIDHDKTLYVKDLKVLEESGYLKSGKSIVVGDNVLFPGAPDYLEYVTTEKGKGPTARKVYYRTEKHDAHVEYLPHIKDLVTVSHVL